MCCCCWIEQNFERDDSDFNVMMLGFSYIIHIIVQQQNIGHKFEKLTQLLLFSHGTEVAYEVWRASNSQFVPEQRIITCLCKLALYYSHHVFPPNTQLLYNYFGNLVYFTHGFMVSNWKWFFRACKKKERTSMNFDMRHRHHRKSGALEVGKYKIEFGLNKVWVWTDKWKDNKRKGSKRSFLVELYKCRVSHRDAWTMDQHC